MGMKFNFLRMKYDDLAELEKLETTMESASEDGWLVQSWRERADGVITVLMVRPTTKAAPEPMAMTSQRSPRLGTAPKPVAQDPEGGPEIRNGKPFVPTKTTPDRSGS